MQNLTFRPFTYTDDDYKAILAIHNAALPDYPEELEEWRHWEQNRPAYCKAQRWVAELDGAMVAFGGFEQFPNMFHPQKFYVNVCVHPAHQLKGIGQRLYTHVIEQLAPLNPIVLRCEVREDFAAANHIIRKHGFVEEMKFWESRLNLTTFDPSPWAGHIEKVLAKGIEIVTLRELMERGGEFERPLYEAMMEMARDVPRPDEYTPVSFEEWRKFNLESPNALPDGYFLAMHEGNFAGVSNLWKAPEEDVLHVGLTATRRPYRRMGIALALKLKAIEYARQRGIRELRTGNETRNRPMLSINEALGFVKQPVWVAYMKAL